MADQKTRLIYRVAPTEMPGTMEADIATLKADAALIKADIALMQDDMVLIKAAVEGAIPAGEAHIGETGINATLVSVTPVIAAEAFAENDIVGGKLTLANALRVSGGSGFLESLHLMDTAKQDVPLEIFLFNAALAGTYNDNAPEAVTAADWLKWIGTIEIEAGDYKRMANASLVSLGGMELPVKVTSGTSLYALIRTTGAPTYTANCLQLTFGFKRN